MRDKELYTQILGIRSPWQVADVGLSVEAGEVKVYVEQGPGAERRCWWPMYKVLYVADDRGQDSLAGR